MPIVYADPLRGRAREAARIPSTTSDVLTEQFAQSFEENPIAAGSRWLALANQKNTGPRLDANTARQRIKEAGLEGSLTVDDAGITPQALDTLMERKRIERRRQDIFARAEGGFLQGAGRLGVAAATTLADPVSAGLNFVPIVGQARYARWLGQAGSLAGRVGVRAGVGAAEGAAGAAIVEPLIYGSRRAEQADYDATDSLLNVAFGGILGTGMHTTVGTLGEVLSKSAGRAGPTPVGGASATAQAMKPADFQATVRAAVGQASEGRPVDVAGIVQAATRVPDEERLITRQVREMLAQRESSLRGVAEGPEGMAVGLRGDDVSERLARAIAGRDEDARLLAVDAMTQIQDEARRLAMADNANADAIRRARDAGGEDPIFQKWRSSAEANVTTARTRAAERIGQANKLVADLQKDMERLRRVRSAESELTGMRQAMQAAKTLDDLIEALPTDMQTGFKRRVAIGREAGDVRSRGERLADEQPFEEPSSAPDTERADVAAYAEETLAREPATKVSTTEDMVTAIKEEETLATQQLTELYNRLGRELKSAEYDEIIQAAKDSERWARTAELATVCLVRGG